MVANLVAGAISSLPTRDGWRYLGATGSTSLNLAQEDFRTFFIPMVTLQGTNISHLWKRKIIFPATFKGDVLVPWRVNYVKN